MLRGVRHFCAAVIAGCLWLFIAVVVAFPEEMTGWHLAEASKHFVIGHHRLFLAFLLAIDLFIDVMTGGEFWGSLVDRKGEPRRWLIALFVSLWLVYALVTGFYTALQQPTAVQNAELITAICLSCLLIVRILSYLRPTVVVAALVGRVPRTPHNGTTAGQTVAGVTSPGNS